jgi:hypothetical protein
MNATVKFLGNCDEVNTCECCGKKHLKSTVALSIDDADPVYYGVTCAARALSMQAKDVRVAARTADREIADAKWKIQQEADSVRIAAWHGWLSKNGSGGDPFTQIESLGGYLKAREIYQTAMAA